MADGERQVQRRFDKDYLRTCNFGGDDKIMKFDWGIVS